MEVIWLRSKKPERGWWDGEKSFGSGENSVTHEILEDKRMVVKQSGVKVMDSHEKWSLQKSILREMVTT